MANKENLQKAVDAFFEKDYIAAEKILKQELIDARNEKFKQYGIPVKKGE
jgi:hypothetical protein